MSSVLVFAVQVWLVAAVLSGTFLLLVVGAQTAARWQAVAREGLRVRRP